MFILMVPTSNSLIHFLFYGVLKVVHDDNRHYCHCNLLISEHNWIPTCCECMSKIFWYRSSVSLGLTPHRTQDLNVNRPIRVNKNTPKTPKLMKICLYITRIILYLYLFGMICHLKSIGHFSFEYKYEYILI